LVRAQRESFDTIGLVGFGKDFQASRDIDNSVSNNFRLLQSFLEEATKRAGNPLRRFSCAPVRANPPFSLPLRSTKLNPFLSILQFFHRGPPYLCLWPPA
jgi:hypothetical protein